LSNGFSATARSNFIRKLSSETFDLVIIGGGITGAGIALDAASRGLNTALIEQGDFAQGTSSRSTKLIHGGLRYLKQLELMLVHETGTERSIIHRNASHIVKPENMLLPIIINGSLGKFSTSLGLWIYDILAGVKKEERRKMLSKEQTLLAEPLLRKGIVIGGGLYKEYKTDDARLTIEILKTAFQLGATCINYVKAYGFHYDNGKITAVKATDTITQTNFEIKALKVVNAAGPWVDELRQVDHSLKGKKLHLTKGIHIVVPYEKMPLRQSVYFDVADGRMMFAIPHNQVTYIGTTDTTYTGNINSPHATREDVEYVLNAVNYMFPSVCISVNDIVSTWAGLRPLIHEDGKAPSELSRKDEIFFSESGLISIAGGKLTGFRKMAQRVTDEVVSQLRKEKGMRFKPCHTDTITLSGGYFDTPDESCIERYKQCLVKKASQIQPDYQQIAALVDRYGTNTDTIIELACQLAQTEQDAGKCLLFAELEYGIMHEMCTNLSDFLIRRTGRLYFERNSVLNIYQLLKPRIASQLNWNAAQSEKYDAAFIEEYEAVMGFLDTPVHR
jgi:glycerol-3-phosphate dehydrogenase